MALIKLTNGQEPCFVVSRVILIASSRLPICSAIINKQSSSPPGGGRGAIAWPADRPATFSTAAVSGRGRQALAATMARRNSGNMRAQAQKRRPAAASLNSISSQYSGEARNFVGRSRIINSIILTIELAGDNSRKPFLSVIKPAECAIRMK